MGSRSAKEGLSSPKGDRKEFKKRDGKDSQSPQGIVCYECNGHGHLKKECPNYLKGKGKVFATTFSVRTYVIHMLGTYVTILCNWLIL